MKTLRIFLVALAFTSLQVYAENGYNPIVKENGSIDAVDSRNFKDCDVCPEMVVIPAGSFEIGSNIEPNRKNTRRVTISHTFAIGKYEVTQAEWRAVMGENPPGLKFTSCGDTCPVERVSWNDVQEFIQKLNAKTGRQYRAPLKIADIFLLQVHQQAT